MYGMFSCVDKFLHVDEWKKSPSIFENIPWIDDMESSRAKIRSVSKVKIFHLPKKKQKSDIMKFGPRFLELFSWYQKWQDIEAKR